MLLGHKLARSYGTTVALVDATIGVEPGTITALIGPSGSGKTTLLKALSLLDPPDSGYVELDGVTLNQGSTPWPGISVVFQQLFLWPHLSAKANCTLPLRRLDRREDFEIVEALFARYGVSHLSHNYPNELSAGQRQLVALIRAVALRPKYLLLDEVTSALDVEYVAAVLEHLEELRESGTGVLLITHSIRFAQRSASQIAFMDRGRLVETGSAQLLESPRSPRLQSFLSAIKRSE